MFSLNTEIYRVKLRIQPEDTDQKKLHTIFFTWLIYYIILRSITFLEIPHLFILSVSSRKPTCE